MSKSWKHSLLVYTKKESLILLCLGFSSGLPAVLIYGNLSIWLTEIGINRATITALSWVTFCFSFKFLWAPFVDQWRLPFLYRLLGKRRSWLILTQLGVIAGLAGMALTDPSKNLTNMVYCALVAAFFSATQDIVIDAFRIERVRASEDQGAMAAVYVVGYRLAMIVAGAGGLALAQFFDPNPATNVYDYSPWRLTYLIMAGCMLFGILTTLFVSEPEVASPKSILPGFGESDGRGLLARCARWFFNAFVMPFGEFVQRNKWPAILILLLIGLYRLSDIVLGTYAYPFYTEMGFQKLEIAAISKGYGVFMTILGGVLAGFFMPRFGVMKMMFLGAILSSATNLLFAAMVGRGHDLSFLTMVISADNLSVGIASTAFIAYMSGLTNVQYTATQYALFSALMQFSPKLLGGFSGDIVNAIGHVRFFIFTTVIGLPVLVLIALAARFAPSQKQQKVALEK